MSSGPRWSLPLYRARGMVAHLARATLCDRAAHLVHVVGNWKWLPTVPAKRISWSDYIADHSARSKNSHIVSKNLAAATPSATR
jgi:hypothetical protein